MDSRLSEPLRIALNSAPQWYRCAPGWSWSPRPLPDHDLWFVAAGRGQVEWDAQAHALHAGVCFVWRPGDAPRARHDPAHPLQVFACHFDPTPQQTLQLPQPQCVRDHQFFEASAHRAAALWQRGDAAARAQAKQLLGALLWQLNDEARTPAAPADAVMEELARALRADLSAPWSLDAMAQSVHLSRSQLVRRFRASFGRAPVQFLSEARLEAARGLLLETDWTLQRIAHHLGYGDAAFFSRQFKTRFGITPGKLRGK